MMRSAALILVSALALAACNPSAQSGGGNTASNGAAPSASGGFPNLSNASYRAEGTMNPTNGEPIPVVMVRSGQKSRMEMNRPEGQMVMISDLETHDAYSIVTQGGHTMAMHMDLSGTAAANPTAVWQSQTSGVTQTGPCSAAGESGTSWTRTPQPDEQVAGQPAKPMSACVTSDGILLWTKSGDDTTWQTTRVTRGPQDPAQFTVPAGVHVQEMGNISAQAAAMAARMRAAQNGH